MSIVETSGGVTGAGAGAGPVGQFMGFVMSSDFQFVDTSHPKPNVVLDDPYPLLFEESIDSSCLGKLDLGGIRINTSIEVS